MATDPVCGMTVDEKSDVSHATHAGNTFYFCSPRCLQTFQANPGAYAQPAPPTVIMPPSTGPMESATRAGKSATERAKDPICGMVVDKATALKTERGGRAYYFCSSGCQRTFESPEQELKSMRRRVAIAAKVIPPCWSER